MSSARFDHRFIAPVPCNASRAAWRAGAWPESPDDPVVDCRPRR